MALFSQASTAFLILCFEESPAPLSALAIFSEVRSLIAVNEEVCLPIFFPQFFTFHKVARTRRHNVTDFPT